MKPYTHLRRHLRPGIKNVEITKRTEHMKRTQKLYNNNEWNKRIPT